MDILSSRSAGLSNWGFRENEVARCGLLGNSFARVDRNSWSFGGSSEDMCTRSGSLVLSKD